MKKTTIFLIILVLSASAYKARAQENTQKDKNYVRMANSEIERNPQSWMLDFSKIPVWNYCHGLELQSILQVWQKTKNPKYFNYAYQYADTMIAPDGKIRTYKLQEYNIDRLNSGKFLFTIYKETKEKRFKFAMDSLYKQTLTHPRTKAGSFWHKKIYPHQVWLDGLYMACPFLAEYGKTFGKPELFDEVALQIIDCHKYLYDPKSGLYHHGWDESRQQKWADSRTGQSPNIWLRSIGWYMMAIVDVLDFMPEDHPQRHEIITILQHITHAVEKYQDPQTGMWFQVTDQIGREGNYVESSGSAMILYTWVKAAQKGYIDWDYLEKGKSAYQKFVNKFVKENKDGTITVTDACAVAGLGGNKKYRDGSYQYYLSEPVRDNDPKAVAPFIMVSVLLDK